MTRTSHALTTLILASVGAVAVAGTLSPAGASPQPAPSEARTTGTHRSTGSDIDIRKGVTEKHRLSVQRAEARASARPATRALAKSLGDDAILDIDGVTGTPRRVAVRGGFLTAPSTASPDSVALAYVRDHAPALGLASADLSTFRLRRDYVDVAGIHHLSWTQVIDGTPVFSNGLLAAVTADGRLLEVGGSPVPGALVGKPARAQLTADQALTRAAGEPTKAGPRSTASKVLLVARSGTYLGWQTLTMDADQPAVSVVDAATGKVIYRQSLRVHERTEKGPHSTGVAFRNHPKPAYNGGGKYLKVNYTKKGWLSGTAKRLKGNNSHAYSDVNDDGRPQKKEEVGPKSKHQWNYRLKPFHLKRISWCDNPNPCSWNPNKPYSWRTNRAQNTAQVFFFVNNFHDYLERKPIGFTEAAGNFQTKNFSGKGKGHDAVDTQTLDGANSTGTGLPDGAHIDNANMDTPPDGHAPVMQMYLQHQPFTSYPDGDPFPPNNTGDESDTVYHEYTHGLSHRLVIDPTGLSTLGPIQGDAMGEAWSDFYALDYLVTKKLERDKPRPDVRLGEYDGAGAALVRTEAIDCKVSSVGSPECTGGDTGHAGGYTYADYAKIVGGPEVHGDGEIWGQTLWDLRAKLGHKKTANLVTRGMELTTSSNPSYLDMRDSILMADTAVYGGAHENTIWQVFATRGMGYFSGSLTGDDAAPAADFHTPPSTVQHADIAGTVTDEDSGDPVEGAVVTLPFQGGNPVNPSAVTDADGHYTISNVVVGDYSKLVVNGDGYLPVSTPVTVSVSGATKDFSIRRDWAAASGGATIADFNGPDYSIYGCGPGEAIDLSQATGWSSTTGDDDGTPTTDFIDKFIVIALPTKVDITGVGIDPAATCGDGGSASLGKFAIETSSDGGSTWTPAATGEFTLEDRGLINQVDLTAGANGVDHVKVIMQGNQTPDFETNCPDGAYSGCSYTDLSEVTVYGAASP